MQRPAERIREGLCFIVIVQAGQVAPAGVAAQFNQPRPEHDAKGKPAEQPEDDGGRRPTRKRPPVQQRAQENAEKTRLQELNFPAIRIPVLSDVNKRHIQRPQQRHENRVGIAQDDQRGQGCSRPCHHNEEAIGKVQPKQTRQLQKPLCTGTEVRSDPVQKQPGGHKPVIAD